MTQGHVTLNKPITSGYTEHGFLLLATGHFGTRMRSSSINIFPTYIGTHAGYTCRISRRSSKRAAYPCRAQINKQPQKHFQGSTQEENPSQDKLLWKTLYMLVYLTPYTKLVHQKRGRSVEPKIYYRESLHRVILIILNSFFFILSFDSFERGMSWLVTTFKDSRHTNDRVKYFAMITLIT
jgi:hypothetical protein